MSDANDAGDAGDEGVTIGLDAGIRDRREADHLLHRLAAELPLPPGAFGCTHRVADPEPHLALSLGLPGSEAAREVFRRLGGVAGEAACAVLGRRTLGPAARRAGARAAALAGAARGEGRAVVFPGSAGLPAALTVGELLGRTAIARVEALGGVAPAADAALDTRGHVRPEWQDGVLLLRLMPARGGSFVPFEIPDPHPCCGGDGDH
ncbi:hypothetical protein [Streptomyces sp. 6N223]|uniref:hypothetical protein n=1 Tax=Streptomyces sp. 6N223 TaxID=3457412 RepID=UPI003FD17483